MLPYPKLSSATICDMHPYPFPAYLPVPPVMKAVGYILCQNTLAYFTSSNADLDDCTLATPSPTSPLVLEGGLRLIVQHLYERDGLIITHTSEILYLPSADPCKWILF